MSARATRAQAVPVVFGVACLLAFFGLIEALVRAGAINPFIVPLPSEILLIFRRIVTEEHVVSRFFLTFGEAMVATAMLSAAGIALGVLLHRVRIVRLATETWIAALASAPLVLMYPLFLVMFGRSAWTIIMIAFVSSLPPVILKTLEGLSGARQVLINVGRSFKLTPCFKLDAGFN